MTVLSPVLVQRFCDNNGNPLFGGQLYSYQAGTTTPLATYTDSTGSTANTNPVVLNARGEANVWIPANTAYKFVLEDSAGNTIWTVDQVQIQQYLTIYGGVDTGSANAYVLTFTAPFSSYSDGIVLYWVPSNTNTSGSTLNVNGIGVISIVNPDGSALVAGQIVANQPATVMYKGGDWYLLLTGTNPQVLPFFKKLTSGTTIPDAGGTQQLVGFLGMPQNTQNAAYTTVLADNGKQIYHSDGSAYTWTIPANSSVAYPVGTTITFVNDASGAVNITLAITTDTMVWVPSGATGTRTIAQYGRAVALKVASTRWWVSGVGIS